MSTLFSPIGLRGLQLENRIVVSPMCQYSAQNGSATDWHLVHLGQFALSGAGLVIVEATHVEERGRITHGCLGLYSDANEAALRRVVAFFKESGSTKLGIQLSHAGRKGSAHLPWIRRGQPLALSDGAWDTVSASGLPFAEGWPEPRALDASGLDAVKRAHVDSTLRAARLGFDLAEVHIAHGYLLHEFLSPLSNRRTDGYGGSLDNRMRFPLEVFEAMREAWPADRPMGVRHSAKDWVDGGWDVPDAERFAIELRGLGCDYLTASSGGLSLQQQIPVDRGHQVEFARALRRVAGMPVMAVGMIFDPHHAEAILAEGSADMVALARGMLSDPHWAWRAAAALQAEARYPVQYLRAYHSKWLRNQRAGCSP